MVRMFRRSNGRLYVEYVLNGRTVQKSTGLIDTPKNRKLVKKEVIPALERKILLGEVSNDKPKNFDYYAGIFLRDKSHLKSYPQIVIRVDLLNAFFGSMRIDEIRRFHIKDWVRERLGVNTPKTVKEYLSHLRAIFNIALDYEHISDNIVKGIELPAHKKESIEPFSPEEVTQLLTKANDWLRLYLAIGFFTGLRTGEILGLMRSDIDLKARVIHVRRNVTKGRITTPKTEKSFRKVPILDDLVPFLKSLPKTMYLFSKNDGKPFSDFPGNRREEWRKLLEICGIKYRKIYATRHTFIVSMLKYSDLSILEVAQLAGHTNTQMIIQNYGKFIKGEHLKIDRKICLFTDNSTDRLA